MNKSKSLKTSGESKSILYLEGFMERSGKVQMYFSLESASVGSYAMNILASLVISTISIKHDHASVAVCFHTRLNVNIGIG